MNGTDTGLDGLRSAIVELRETVVRLGALLEADRRANERASEDAKALATLVSGLTTSLVKMEARYEALAKAQERGEAERAATRAMVDAVRAEIETIKRSNVSTEVRIGFGGRIGWLLGGAAVSGTLALIAWAVSHMR